jgi:hypothetical protein
MTSIIVRRMLLVAATAAAALTGTSCNPNAGSIFPMTIGSTWSTESYTLAGPTGGALDTSETGVTTTTALEKANLTNGKEVVRFRHESTVHVFEPDSSYSTTTYTLLREEDDVIMVYAALDDTIGDTLMMVNPAVGQDWGQGIATAIIVGQEDVTVPAGTYKKAWKVKTVANLGIMTVEVLTWYARGIGNVKMHSETEFLGSIDVIDEELTSATIK